MTFLPIADRELRVASRKRSTFWLRVVAALVALVIGGGFMVIAFIATFMPFGGRVQLGGPLFATLTWLGLAAALSAGLFFTSDCLSEEKREGTLGFLFLTDLHGYDVVLGKLLVTSLRCAFALLAMFPVLAITQLMGGVEAAMFWKTLLSLMHALFFSLAAGMFVSAISRDPQKALVGTLLLLVLFLAGAPIADAALAATMRGQFRAYFSLTSPGYVFASADDWGTGFWTSLLASELVAWLMLGLACGLIPRTWQTRAEKTSPTVSRWRYWWRYGSAKRRGALRQKLLDIHPVTWLASRERWQSFVIWTMAVLVIVVFVTIVATDLPSQVWMGWSYVGGALSVLAYLWAASQASRFFVDARRNGTMELLLATPLSAREIVVGPWRALVRLFTVPLVIFLLVHCTGTTLAHMETWGMTASLAGQNVPPTLARHVVPIVTGLTTIASVLANLYALCWFGLWMGLTSKSTHLAALKTIVFVWIVPGMIIHFVASLLTGILMVAAMAPTIAKGSKANPTSLFAWYPLLAATLTMILSVGKDVVFAVWARRRLFTDFRVLAMQAVSPIRHVPLVVPTRPPISPPAGRAR